MPEAAVARARAPAEGTVSAQRRVAFVGPPLWLDCCAPAAPAPGLIECERFDLPVRAHSERLLADVQAFAPHATVVFAPDRLFDGDGQAEEEIARALGVCGGATLGVLVDGLPHGAGAEAAAALDRLVAFDPALTGRRVGDAEVWRAIPPPVADLLYADVRPLRHAPTAMSIGRATPHRETMLIPAKHDHDLLQVLHGVGGAMLAELLHEYDVGVYLPPSPGAHFGWQAGAHLAAGQLLLCGTLSPLHGLERGIDYLEIDSAASIVWVLQRLARFPEMYQRIRVRGRMKAEQYRASRLFARIVHDLLADVAAFGR